MLASVVLLLRLVLLTLPGQSLLQVLRGLGSSSLGLFLLLWLAFLDLGGALRLLLGHRYFLLLGARVTETSWVLSLTLVLLGLALLGLISLLLGRLLRSLGTLSAPLDLATPGLTFALLVVGRLSPLLGLGFLLFLPHGLFL